MADITKTGVLQQIDGDDVITLHPETSAAQVKTADGSDVETKIGGLENAVLQVVDTVPEDAADGLYFVTDS
jgi:hypothetical protein